MASILKRRNPSGKIVYKVQFKDQYGKRHEIVAGSTKKSAEMLKRRIEEEVAAGTYGIPKKRLLFSDLTKRYLEAKKPTWKPSTHDDVNQVINKHLNPYFGDLPVVEITPSRVQDFLSHKLKRGASPATTGKIFRYLKGILRFAYSLEIIDRDPTRPIRAPKVERVEIRYLSIDEVNALIEAAEGDMKPLLIVACYTGLRAGEILGLTWRDISLDSGLLIVNRSWRSGKGFSSPKTRTSTRMVPLISLAVESLVLLYEEKGKPGSDEVVFFNYEDVDRYHMLRKGFESTLNKAELPSIRFHDLRHTFTALSIEGGVDPKTLQALLGHSSIRVTMDTYGHLYSTALDRAAKSLEAVVAGSAKVVQLHKGYRRLGSDSMSGI